MLTADQITAACRRHCDAVVHRAAFEGLSGRRATLHAMGLPARDERDAHEALRVAFELLSPEDRAADLADATIALAKLPPASRAAPAEGEEPTA